MKKEYDKKKKLVIFILTAVAVCLAGGCEADHRADGSDCS